MPPTEIVHLCFNLFGQFHELACRVDSGQRKRLDQFVADNPWFGPMGDLYLEASWNSPDPIGQTDVRAWLAGLGGSAGQAIPERLEAILVRIEATVSADPAPCQEYADIYLVSDQEVCELARRFTDDTLAQNYQALLCELLHQIKQAGYTQNFALCCGGGLQAGSPGQVAEVLDALERPEVEDLANHLRSLQPAPGVRSRPGP